MKDLALEAAMRFDDPGRRRNALREYLQAFVMRSLHESEASPALAFVGGTALRGAGDCAAADWRRLVRVRLDNLDTGVLARDVQPFLERPADVALLDRANFEAVLAAGAPPS